ARPAGPRREPGDETAVGAELSVRVRRERPGSAALASRGALEIGLAPGEVGREVRGAADGQRVERRAAAIVPEQMEAGDASRLMAARARELVEAPQEQLRRARERERVERERREVLRREELRERAVLLASEAARRDGDDPAREEAIRQHGAAVV